MANRRFWRLPFVKFASYDLGFIDRLLYYHYLAIWLKELGKLDEMIERARKYIKYAQLLEQGRIGYLRMNMMEADGLFDEPNTHYGTPIEFLAHLSKASGIKVSHSDTVWDILVLIKSLQNNKTHAD